MTELAGQYGQDFFLDLARPRADTDEARAEARERWNAWRRDPTNARVRVNFERVDFSLPENAAISFAGFEFGDETQFEMAVFGRAATFDRAKLGSRTSFDLAHFGNAASFRAANFANGARFASAVFDRGATFSGAEFRDGASFDQATFGDVASFDGATFGHVTSFKSAKFGNEASFDGATFGRIASFASAAFGYATSFACATFGDGARFDSATFEHVAKFDTSTFGDSATFENVTFGDCAAFECASFGSGATFDSATFGRIATFRASLFRGRASFDGSPVGPWLERMRTRFAAGVGDYAAQAFQKVFFERQEREGSGPHAFLELNFSDARILGPVSFARRTFERPADFTGAQFCAPPDFEGSTNLQRIDFTGARIGFVPPDHKRWTPHWTEDSQVPVRLRAFRKIAEDTKNHDLERDLYIEERKAERGVHRQRLCDAFWAERNDLKQVALLGPLFIAWCWRRVMDGYWLFSDYGRSVLRPPLWLALTLWPLILTFDASLTDQRRLATQSAFAAATNEAAATKEKAIAATGRKATAATIEPAEEAKKMKQKYYAATRQLAIANTIPFVGALSIDGEVKKFLLCGAPPADDRAAKACVPIAPRAYQLTLIGQNVLSALLFFFFGLALRNYFKVK